MTIHPNEENREQVVEPVSVARSADDSAAVGRAWALTRRLAEAQKSQVNRNMGAGSTMALVGTCLAMGSYPVYLHYLGYSRYGLWLILSVIVSVAQVGNLGIPWALMQLVAEEHAHCDWEGVRTYINLSCAIIAGIGALFTGVVIAFRPLIVSLAKLSGSDAAQVSALLPYVALLSVLVLLFSTFNASLGGLGRIDLTSYNETLAQILVVVFCAVFLYMKLEIRGMVIGTLLGYLVAQVISLVQVQRLLPLSLIGRTRIDRRKVKRLLTTGGWIMSSGIFTSAFNPFTRLMLSRYAGLAAVTVNEICLTGSMRIRNIFDSAIRPMMPEASSLRVTAREQLHDKVRQLDRKAFRVSIFLALPVFLFLIVGMTPLLHIWLHKQFNIELPGTFRVALVGAFASLLGSSAYYILIGLGGARDAAYSSAIQFGVNAAVLLSIASLSGHITVLQSAISFGSAFAASTVYLRLRMLFLMRSGNSLSSSFEKKLNALEV